MQKSWPAYTVTMTIAFVLLSLLAYVGPPFGPEWSSVLAWLNLA